MEIIKEEEARRIEAAELRQKMIDAKNEAARIAFEKRQEEIRIAN